MLNHSPLSALMVPNASCSSAEFRMSALGGAENQPEASNDVLKMWRG